MPAAVPPCGSQVLFLLLLTVTCFFFIFPRGEKKKKKSFKNGWKAVARIWKPQWRWGSSTKWRGFHSC